MHQEKHPAFTLIELLTVVAIVAILATFLVPIIAKARRTAVEAECVSNLRQIGQAISLYVLENDGVLPGPFGGGQGVQQDRNKPGYTTYTAYNANDPAVSESQAGSLPVRLGPYMGIEADGRVRSTRVFTCPAFDPVAQAGAASYQIAVGIDFEKGSFAGMHTGGFRRNMAEPFGYPNSSRRPQPMAVIENLPIASSRLWAIADCFKRLPGGVVAGWDRNLPEQPIHGAYGNALFFDWHVGKIDESGPLP